MIKANEIRIGNWIFDAGDEQKPFQIEEIRKDGDGFNGYYIVFRDGSFMSHIESDLIQPIVLSPEILEKLGFEKRKVFHQKTIIGGYVISYDGNAFELFDPVFGKGSGVILPENQCQYLHQLQNILFDYSGEELTVNL